MFVCKVVALPHREAGDAERCQGWFSTNLSAGSLMASSVGWLTALQALSESFSVFGSGGWGRVAWRWRKGERRCCVYT